MCAETDISPGTGAKYRTKSVELQINWLFQLSGAVNHPMKLTRSSLDIGRPPKSAHSWRLPRAKCATWRVRFGLDVPPRTFESGLETLFPWMR